MSANNDEVPMERIPEPERAAAPVVAEQQPQTMSKRRRAFYGVTAMFSGMMLMGSFMFYFTTAQMAVSDYITLQKQYNDLIAQDQKYEGVNCSKYHAPYSNSFWTVDEINQDYNMMLAYYSTMLLNLVIFTPFLPWAYQEKFDPYGMEYVKKNKYTMFFRGLISVGFFIYWMARHIIHIELFHSSIIPMGSRLIFAGSVCLIFFILQWIHIVGSVFFGLYCLMRQRTGSVVSA